MKESEIARLLASRSNRLERIMQNLRESLIFVEGQKDKKALSRFGINAVLTISGNLKLSCKIASESNPRKVIVLTDLDERGNELAKEAEDELARYGIKADNETRKAIAMILNLKNMENFVKKYEKFLEEIEKETEMKKLNKYR